MPDMLRLIDTHCHLTDRRLRHDVPGLLHRARDAGVVAVICAAGDLEESGAADDLARCTADVYCLAGVHPHDAKSVPADYLRQIEQLTGEAGNVALGEIGLDYYRNLSPPDVQRRVFAEQLDLARRLGKKAVVHTRDALHDTLSILKDSLLDGAGVVFHSCTESAAGVRQLLEIGAMVSFSGIVTFKNAACLREAAGIVPDARLLIETDAPYLSPEPVRKMKDNEPANVAHVAACLAALRGTSPEQLAEQTTANARRFFGLR